LHASLFVLAAAEMPETCVVAPAPSRPPELPAAVTE